MTLTENPFLTGNYAPVHEELTATDLAVDGTIPAELTGRYLRIGPNPFVDPTGPYHWFVGDGMVHGLELGSGKANAYRNRWVRTDEIAHAMGETPREGPTPPMYDTSNTHVISHAVGSSRSPKARCPTSCRRRSTRCGAPTSAGRSRRDSLRTPRSIRSRERCSRSAIGSPSRTWRTT